MIKLNDLGLSPVGVASAASTPAKRPPKDGLVPGSVKARLLYGVLARVPVQVVDSPPGAGKSTLIVEAVATLLRRSPLSITVACPTRRGAYDMAERLVAALGAGPDVPDVVHAVSGGTHPAGTIAGADRDRRHVIVRTVASCAFAPPEVNVLFVDEAYQTTFSQIAVAADGADQVVLVGDPGQIGPVVTQNTEVWEGWESAPHLRAPEVFGVREDATVMQLDATYRLGPDTVHAISPLYDFEFESRRVERTMVDSDGNPIPELSHVEVEPPGSIGDMATMRVVADLAISHVGMTVETVDDDGDPITLVLDDSDIAVVVSHNVQATALDGILRAAGHGGISVGTADRMQGGQWHAVVALDPLIGHTTTSPHQINPGRLCVMASRHMTAMVWVHDGLSMEKLTAAADEYEEADVGLAVRRALIG